ncbi:polysaccharide biosynthesis protein [Flagellimonas marinaquae]
MMINKALQYIFANHASPLWVLVIDIGMACIAYVVAFLIRFELSILLDVSAILRQMLLMVPLALLFFLVFESYKGVIRETTVKDATRVLSANTMQMCVALGIKGFIDPESNAVSFDMPTSVIIINFLVLTVMMVLSRFVFKSVYNDFKVIKAAPKKTLIYGAGESGVMTLQAIQNDSQAAYKVVGFLDDDKEKCKKKINQLPIYLAQNLSHATLDALKIDLVIISIQDISNTRLSQLADWLLDFKVNVNIVPPVQKWYSGNLNVKQIKPLEIEDLLNREPISLNNPQVAEYIREATVLITGAAGSIGSELVRQISRYAYKHLVLVDIAESALYAIEQELRCLGHKNLSPCVVDICDADSIALIFERYQPKVVIHAAAYKHVPLMEQNPYQAIRNNLLGTKTIADLALYHGVASFLMVSTDKAVNPTNVMGATKRAAEMYLTAIFKAHPAMKVIITRFGNVLGSNGSVIPLFKKQLNDGGPLTVTHKDIFRYFMTIGEACSLILEAGTMGQGGEIFVFDMGEPVRIFDMAKRMIELAGLRYPEDVDIAITGLRPGEKLFEELLASKETTLATHHPKILVAQTESQEYTKVLESVKAIVSMNSPYDPHFAVRALKLLIPNYKSQNSVWEQYDEPLTPLNKAE